MLSQLLYPRNSTFYSLGRTTTFRAASGAILDTYGGNLQNLQKRMRRLYWADKGMKLLQCDQSGAEALIVAFLAMPKKFRDLFLHGIKPHVYVALHMFKDKWKEKDPTLDIDGAVALAPKDMRSHPQWLSIDKLIKSSDNWPAAERYYYLAKQTCHCVDKDTEVLTPTGWKKVSDVSELEQIAVWNIDRKIHFENVKWNSQEFEGFLNRLDNGAALNQMVTDEHTICYESNHKFRTIKARQLTKYRWMDIPINGDYAGGNISLPEDDIKLLVAIQADGWIQTQNQVRFHFRKQRKINRLEGICERMGYKLTCNEELDGTFHLVVYNIGHLIRWFGGEKKWGNWLLTFSAANLDTLLHELKYWDGYYTHDILNDHKREEYISNIYENVDWVKTIAHLRNKQSKIATAVKADCKDVYKSSLNARCFSRVFGKATKKVAYKGKVYCPTTSTGYFMIRRNGQISITGNSANYGIKAPTFAFNVLEKSEGKIALSRHDSEFFLSFYRTMFPEIPAWNEETRQIVDKTRTLYNLFGHPRFFTGAKNDKFFREAYAFVPQSTVGEITHKAFTRLQEFIEDNKLNWDILANTHDSYLVQCPDDKEEIRHCALKMTEFMNQELTSPSRVKFNMKSEIAIGMNWAPKSSYNPEGLEEYSLTA